MDQFSTRKTLGDLHSYLRLLKRYERFWKYQHERLLVKVVAEGKRPGDDERLKFLKEARDELEKELRVYDQRGDAPRHWR